MLLLLSRGKGGCCIFVSAMSDRCVSLSTGYKLRYDDVILDGDLQPNLSVCYISPTAVVPI